MVVTQYATINLYFCYIAVLLAVVSIDALDSLGDGLCGLGGL